MEKRDKNPKTVSFKEQPEIIKSESQSEKPNVEIVNQEKVQMVQTPIQTNNNENVMENNIGNNIGNNNENVVILEQNNTFMNFLKSFSFIPNLQTIFFIILLIACFFIFIHNNKISNENFNNQTNINQNQQIHEL